MDNTLFPQTRVNYPSVGVQTFQGELKPEILRVAAYCRVSSYSDSQEDSLENQTVHYTRYIRSNPNWRFIGIYSDQGKTGTKIDSRSGFQKLIRYALEGKIDLILCKSISRFARNVIDELDTIRVLKENGVRVIFEKAQEKLLNIKSYKKRGEIKTYPLSGRMICSECGGNLQHCDCRGLVTWKCGNRIKSKSICR